MKKIVLLASLFLIILSCKKDPKEGYVTLTMNHKVADSNLELEVEKYTSPTGYLFSIQKLWYYISEVTFIAEDGTEQTFHQGHLTKIEDVNTYNMLFNKITPAKYNKVRFQFGFKGSDNHLEYLENTIDNQNMQWFNEDSYHYMKLEGVYSVGVHKPFKMHYGPTDGNDNSFTVELDIPSFEINDNSFQIFIDMDLLEWMKSPTDYDFESYTMVMSNQSVQEIYKANGQSVFSFKELFQDEE